MTEIKYVLVDPKGVMNTSIMSGWRKGVETLWLSCWINKDWKKWYQKGYRIKKVKVTTELL